MKCDSDCCCSICVVVRWHRRASSADWPMWGGTPSRNMVSSMKGLPTHVGRQDRQEREVGGRARVAVLRQSRRSPAASSSIGTNNEAVRDPKQPGDRGVVMAFREADGEFMWQATFEKLAAGRANDWPYQGIASSALIENGIAYFIIESRPGRRRRYRRAFTTRTTTGRSRTRSSPASTIRTSSGCST